ncbi:protein argonaute-2-like [Pollicipes pollicipes]|uniref:protein argonaute-2-like n=1 Tax=Pollicipes pollicipes TaxID=41117 RepID=UPI0018851C28|nr:protein argonaute-2-like [Pollicipes pollicipes]
MVAMDIAQTTEKIFQPKPSEKFESKTYRLQPPKRKAVGEAGRKIKLVANHFDLNIKCTEVYHYDVDIQPRAPKPMKRRIFQTAMKENQQLQRFYPVFDGVKNMYTARQLLDLPPGEQAKLTLRYAEPLEPTRDYTLVIKQAQPCRVDITPILQYVMRGSTDAIPQSAVQALDIVLRHLPSLRFTPVGRSFFPEQGDRIINIGGGCELWIGYFSSIRMGWKQPRINIDVANKAFHTAMPVLDKMGEILGRSFNPDRGLQEWQRNDVNKQMRTLKVEYQRGRQGGKRSYRVNQLIQQSARNAKFMADGRETTVERYFRDTLNTPLQYPNLPCLWVGSRDKKIYIPAELCTIIKGQVNTRKLGAEQVSSMIKNTAVPADQRLKRIEGFVRQAEFNKDPHNREFGLQVADRPTEVTGRVLPAPVLLYSDKRTETPRDGVWSLQAKRFLDARSLNNWVVLNYDPRTQTEKVLNFVRGLREAGGQVGMRIAEPRDVVCRDGTNVDRVDAVKDLTGIRDHFKPELVLVVLPMKNKLYNAVKGAGDVEVGQLTSCVLAKTVFRGDRQTATNICQKINAKMGGSNNGLDARTRPKLLYEPTIVFGADVTHPPPDQVNKPSIAAVVASLDASYHARYGHRVLVQFPSEGRRAEEMIVDLKRAVRELLIEFYKLNNKTKPTRIVFFRDGVSEGQFLHVMSRELEQVRAACTALEASYQPKITFLVVQKRHHTRLFAADLRDTCGRSKNVPPGTVVDSVIAHPTELDYFLVSHQGIQGTSRPTHYHVLHDDSNFTADDLEILTYYMCHLFSRCTRSVSNPAPSYYAHLAAYRARAHHDNFLRVNDIGDDQAASPEQSIAACSPKTVPMYYV